MPAKLIWDSADPQKLTVPAEMGHPSAHQLQGSTLDNLAELAGRVCYDSLGSEKSRSSAEYHAHIREVKHLSVYRHCAFTVEVPSRYSLLFLNRPGIWVRTALNCQSRIRVNLNLQHVIEWNRVKNVFNYDSISSVYLQESLAALARTLAPLSVPDVSVTNIDGTIKIAEPDPACSRERWLSFYINHVSRGLTHELVRHGAYTAVSQRSTRYCDESESPWAWHPLILNGWPDDSSGSRRRLSQVAYSKLNAAQEACQEAYCHVVKEMTTAGVDRKQARGAARGVLGNALETECIFSASLARWREIHALRNHPLADAEIRELFAQIGELLPS